MNIKRTNLDMGKDCLSFDLDIIKLLEGEILEFIEEQNYLKTLEFAKKVMLGREIKTNNTIEGIIHDLSLIDEVIKNRCDNKKIINLYKGYNYILNNRDINKESLKELYNILSDGLLTNEDMNAMGEYYRMEPVYIYKTSRFNEKPYLGLPVDRLDYHMDLFFEYIYSSFNVSTFIKSQIMHFYFVYIHPYFDVNGRCSRTVAMWYLLNNGEYPYIIFNRAISLTRKKYIENIINSRNGNVTPFLKYILVSVKSELEKEYVINNIVTNTGYKLSKEEYEILCYFLSLKGEITIKDLGTIYNEYNSYKTLKDIIDERLISLIDKKIILLLNETNSYINKDTRNRVLGLNASFMDLDTSKIKTLDINKFLK